MQVGRNQRSDADGSESARRRWQRRGAIALCLALLVIGLLWPARVFADAAAGVAVFNPGVGAPAGEGGPPADAELRARILQLLCEGETCSGHGRCVVENKAPVCKCDQGYTRSADNRRCEQSGDEVRAAAALGVAASVLVAGFSVGLTVSHYIDGEASFFLAPIALANASALGPTISAFTAPALGVPGVDGSVGARVAGWVTYIGGMTIGSFYGWPVFMGLGYEIFPDQMMPIWSGLATFSMICFTVDAFVARSQLLELRAEAKRGAKPRAVALAPVLEPVTSANGVSGGIFGVGGSF